MTTPDGIMGRSRKTIILFMFAVITFTASATIKLPLILQSNMVLQRNKVVTIWGFGDAHEKVAIRFDGQTYSAITAKDGRWQVKLPARKSGGPYDIEVKGKSNILWLKNILFGDVWVCGGQSNMQLSLDQIGFKPMDTAAVRNPAIRIFTASVDMDYVPKDDLLGGSWKEVSASSIRNFSATAYFFGKFLHDSLNVPIGLVSDNLGATSVETWMSAEALSAFPQFGNFYREYLAPAKSFKEITAAFERIKPEWESKYYLQGKGIEQKWYLPETDISGWKTMEIPAWWEDQGLADFDGAVWFRKSFDLPDGFLGDNLTLYLNQIDDYDRVWVNGQQVGESFGNQNWRNYTVPANLLKPAGNTLVVRVFDAGGKGGIYSNAIWGNKILLGKWSYKPDERISSDEFPRPHVVNASPFSTPAVLYNGNIAPISPLAITGFIWYQGESNTARAREYRELFPALIRDWRAHFNQGDLPFLFVQLANYMHESNLPAESSWAELREAQSAALTLPNTGMAVITDIGEADDIHPKNKMDVGKRLGLAALKLVYKRDIVSEGPTFQSMVLQGNSIIITYKTGTDDLICRDKYGYIKGFAVAGTDRTFHWAKAEIRGNTVIVSCSEVQKPVAVRYAWSDNPGTADLYNLSGLPAAPFRTDDWPLSTEGKVFSENPWDY